MLCGSEMSKPYDRKDLHYREAKAQGYRSRAALKLIELDDTYGILRSGLSVLDLGAWPGGWLQIAAERVGSAGRVVGIDLVAIDELSYPNVSLIQGDVRDDASISAIKDANKRALFDVILSDMSPKLTGIREADIAGSVGCAELAAFVATQLLKPGGTLVIKVFKGGEVDTFVREIRKAFQKVIRSRLDTTRTSSNENYLICLQKL